MLLQIFIELEKVPQVNEAWVTVAIAAISAAYGLYQSIKSDQELEKVGAEKEALAAREKADLSKLETASQRAITKMAEIGTAQEAEFERRIAGEGELAYQRATDVGGGDLAPAISAGIQGKKMTAIAQFSALQERQEADKIKFGLGVERDIYGKRAGLGQREYDYLLASEQALGQAGQAGQTSIVEAAALGVTGLEGNQNTQRQYIEKDLSLTAYKDLYGQDQLNF